MDKSLQILKVLRKEVVVVQERTLKTIHHVMISCLLQMSRAETQALELANQRRKLSILHNT